MDAVLAVGLIARAVASCLLHGRGGGAAALRCCRPRSWSGW
jgi:hypothetical protein